VVAKIFGEALWEAKMGPVLQWFPSYLIGDYVVHLGHFSSGILVFTRAQFSAVYYLVFISFLWDIF